MATELKTKLRKKYASRKEISVQLLVGDTRIYAACNVKQDEFSEPCF